MGKTKFAYFVGVKAYLPLFIYLFIYLSIFMYGAHCNQTGGHVQNNQLNPIWNEHFEFIIEDVSTQHLTIRIFDDEGVQAAELIGCAQVSLKDLEPGKVKDVWLKLVKDLEVHRDNKPRGEVIY
jgi:Ca2+-dependent lipid-binding protein